MIADRYRAAGHLPQAEGWYRRVLALSPLHLNATLGLASVLSAGGDQNAADQLCRDLRQRVGPKAACQLDPTH